MSEPREITIQHVLISFADAPTEATRNQSEAEALAEKVLSQAKTEVEFSDLVREHSDDPVKPGEENPGVYRLLNSDVEGATFASFVSELNIRASEKEQELIAKVQSGDVPPTDAESEMQAFVEQLQAEAAHASANLPHPRAAMVPAFGDVGFSLEVGEVGLAGYDEKASPFGWHVIKRIA
jgi:hypothetical protein